MRKAIHHIAGRTSRPAMQGNARQATFRPAARSLTASVVSGWPPMPHSPLATSEILTR